MHYRIELGIPGFRDFYNDLFSRAKTQSLNQGEVKLFKKLSKALSFLESNPAHNSLNSHEISELSARYSKHTGKVIKVWQSYLENNTPAAGRLFWCYGPVRGVITIIGLESHPENQKKAGYAKVRLSDLPPL
ncbi:MAG: hypothetical protein JXA71_12340 [Chitinispirillaceae bacterium]|nr:hypothetical protein [Chitinispirillaceae bacterium]